MQLFVKCDIDIAGGLTIQKGFTLIELVFVVTIIALLIGIATPFYASYQQAAKTDAAKADVRIIAAAMKLFSIDNRDVATGNRLWPTAYNQLEGKDPVFKQVYLDEIPDDKFRQGAKYQFLNPAGTSTMLVWSVGPNGVTDGAYDAATTTFAGDDIGVVAH